MAPCRQVLLWSVPSIAVLLGIFWFRRKREFAKSDPGGREKLKSLKEELAEALNAEVEARRTTPLGKAERSIIKSAPIDIVPNGIGSQRSSPLVLTDEEVDIEIEKIIRKKSIEKERIMSASYDNKSLVMNMNTKDTPCIIKSSSSQLYSSFKTNMDYKIGFDITVSPNKEDLKVDKYNDVSKVEIISLHQNGTKMDDVVNEDNTNNEESPGPDAVELNIDNSLVEVSSNNNESDNNQFSTTQTRRISERDSANHSPVDPMLASPSMCHFSDNHSEVRSAPGISLIKHNVSKSISNLCFIF